MSYVALVNTCNDASNSDEQTVNKPNYTPGKALKKAYKLLKRVFKPSSSSSSSSWATGKVIKSTAEQSTVVTLEAALDRCVAVEATNALKERTLTTCSTTLSAEEYENALNELAELEVANIAE